MMGDITFNQSQSFTDGEGVHWQCSDLSAEPQEWTITHRDGTKETLWRITGTNDFVRERPS